MGNDPTARPGGQVRFSYLIANALLPVCHGRSRKGETLMQTSLHAVSVGFALTFALLSLTPVASAGPKEDVAAAASTWARALGEDDPDKVLPLYGSDAVLWGTLSPTVPAHRAPFPHYLAPPFTVLPA